MAPPRFASWNILFLVLGFIVVLNVILAITVALRIDRLELVPGTTDVYRSLPYTLGDYLLFASLAVTIVAFLITILVMLFKSFTDLLYALVVSLTSAFVKAVKIGGRARKRDPKPDSATGNGVSGSREVGI